MNRMMNDNRSEGLLDINGSILGDCYGVDKIV